MLSRTLGRPGPPSVPAGDALARAGALTALLSLWFHATQPYLDSARPGILALLSWVPPLVIALVLARRAPALSPVRVSDVLRPWWLWVALAATFAALHLPDLRSNPLFLDEAYWLTHARLLLSGQFVSPAGYIGDQPANFHSWFVAAFALLTRDAQLAVRLPGVVFLAGTAYQLARLAFVLSGRAAAALAAVFTVFSLWSVHFAAYGWCNVSITPFLASWILASLVEGLVWRCPRSLLRCALATGFAIDTLYVPLVMAGFACVLVLVCVRRVRLRQLVLFSVVVLCAAAPTFGKIARDPEQAVGRVVQFAQGSEFPEEKPLTLGERYGQTARTLLANLRPEPAEGSGRREVVGIWGLMGEWPLILLAGACVPFLLLRAWKRLGERVVLAALVWTTLALVGSNPGTSEWRQSTLQPFLFLMAALPAAEAARALKERARLPAAAWATLAVVGLSQIGSFGWLLRPYRSGQRERFEGREEESCRAISSLASPLLRSGFGVVMPRGISEALLRAYELTEVRAGTYTTVSDVRQRRAELGGNSLVAWYPQGPGFDSLPVLVAELSQGRPVRSWRPGGARKDAAALVIAIAGGTSGGSAPPASPAGDYRGVARMPGGEILVSDFGASCLRVLGPDLELVRQIGRQGPGPLEFEQPSGVAVDRKGLIFVADTWNHRVQVISRAGAFVRECRAGFVAPRGVAVEPDGTVVVADPGSDRLVWMSPDCSSLLAEVRSAGVPVGLLSSAGGELYVAETGSAQVGVYLRRRRVRGFPVPGWRPGFPSEPGLSEDALGRIWLAVPVADEIRAYSRDGRLLASVTKGAPDPAHPDTPMGVFADLDARSLTYLGASRGLVRLPLPALPGDSRHR